MARKTRSQRESFDESLRDARPKKRTAPKLQATRLRIIAGDMGGRKIEYNGDPQTRPMKEKTREAVFSLLGGYLHQTVAMDLFGGTGILAFESISRGSTAAIILELSRASVSTIVSNLKLLRLDEQVAVHNVDTLRWLRSLDANTQAWANQPWVVFCCPPYQLWQTQGQRLTDGLRAMFALAPAGSQFVIETDKHFDVQTHLPELPWDVRSYPPAFISICEKT